MKEIKVGDEWVHRKGSLKEILTVCSFNVDNVSVTIDGRPFNIDRRAFEERYRPVNMPEPPPVFVPGSVVKLKCGGPWMVVTEVDKDMNSVWVQWHDNDGVMQDRYLKTVSIKLVPEEELEIL